MDVHARILSRVAPAALAKGCNKVLLSELEDVRERLSEAKSAFSKLKEVERAVAQLQEGKSDKRRSKSLMELVEETKDVEEEISAALKRFRGLLKVEKELKGQASETVEKKNKEKIKEKIALPVKKEKEITDDSAPENSDARKSSSETDDSSDEESDDSDSGEEGRVGQYGKSAQHLTGELAGPDTTSAKSPLSSFEIETEADDKLADRAQKLLEEMIDFSKNRLLGEGVTRLKKLLSGLERSKLNEHGQEEAIIAVEAVLNHFAQRLEKISLDVRGITRATELAQAIRNVSDARQEARAHFSRSLALLEKIVQDAKTNPKFFRAIHQSLQTVYSVDSMPLAERFIHIAAVRNSIAADIGKKPKAFHMMSMTCAVETITSWIIQLQPVEWTPEIFESVVKFRETVLEFAKSVTYKNLPLDLNRMMASVKSVLDDVVRLGTNVTSSTKFESVRATTIDDQKSNHALMSSKVIRADAPRKLAKILQDSGPQQRANRLGELMSSVEAAFRTIDEPNVQRNAGPMASIVKLVVEWALAQPILPVSASRCTKFCTNVQTFASRIPNDGNRIGLIRMLKPLLAKLAPKPDAGSSPVPISTTKRSREEAETPSAPGNPIAVALENLNMWQDGVFSLKQLDAVMKSVGNVIKERESSRQSDPMVLECVEKLRKCVNTIKKDDHRATRLATINSWGTGSTSTNKSPSSSKKRRK